jgi:ankyrin repeat protein
MTMMVLVVLRRIVLAFLFLGIVNVNAQEQSQDELLLSACLGSEHSGQEEVDVISKLLESGADINVRDPKSGQTCLMGSVLRGKTHLVKFLLEKDADPSIAEKDGFGPPHGAGFQGRVEIMAILKEHGLDVAGDFHKDGHAPLHRACWGREPRHAEVVRYLVEEAGVDVNLKSESGKTCIEMTRNPATIQVLRELGGVKEDEL